MADKRLLASVAILLFLLVSSYVFFSTDLRSPFSSFSLPSYSASPSRWSGGGGRPPPLKVFMYDLPPRFHVGMLSHRGGQENTSGNGVGVFPCWPATSGLKRQHSVEYWMMASLVAGGRAEDAEAVRVLDGEEAEVFFVPFFSSLSFNTHGHIMPVA